MKLITLYVIKIGNSVEDCCTNLTVKNSEVILLETKLVRTGSFIVIFTVPKLEILFMRQVVNLTGSNFFFTFGIKA